jgi:hypothetical protein
VGPMNSFSQRTAESRAVPVSKRRREFREARCVPVEITGFDVRSRYFIETTMTLDVSESGCRFRLNAEVERNSAVSVRVIRRSNFFAVPDPPVVFRILWTKYMEPGWTVAGAKLQPVHLWAVGFPAEAGDKHSPEDSPDSDNGDAPDA